MNWWYEGGGALAPPFKEGCGAQTMGIRFGDVCLVVPASGEKAA